LDLSGVEKIILPSDTPSSEVGTTNALSLWVVQFKHCYLGFVELGKRLIMGIGARSPIWRRALFRAFASTYFRRKGRTADGVFEAYVSPNSSLKVLNPKKLCVDPAHQRFIRDWIDVDSIVWDVGANLGLFAFPAALKARKGRVYGFEPDVELAANLLRSRRLLRNKSLNVSFLCLAVSNSDATATFQISKYSRAMNKLEGAGRWHDSQVVTDQLLSVATMRIDTLSKSLIPPTVIKIDVEGAEMLVLEGGEATVSKYRPTILIEGPRELWVQMGAFFQNHDYVLLDGAAEHQSPLTEPVWDTVAVPREKFLARTSPADPRAGTVLSNSA
jgi:FkbM family methyltransferase